MYQKSQVVPPYEIHLPAPLPWVTGLDRFHCNTESIEFVKENKHFRTLTKHQKFFPHRRTRLIKFLNMHTQHNTSIMKGYAKILSKETFLVSMILFNHPQMMQANDAR